MGIGKATISQQLKKDLPIYKKLNDNKRTY